MVADLMQAVGIDHVVTVDMHVPQIEGFFHVPVDNLTAVPSLCPFLASKLPPNLIVVSPDVGRVRMATEYAQRLGTSVAILHKTRASGTETEVTHVVGDVGARTCLIIDDMISTGGTIANSVESLVSAGAYSEIFVAASHTLLVEDALLNLAHSAIRRIYATDTVMLTDHVGLPLHIVSIAPLLADAIRRILAGESLTRGQPQAFVRY
jgi:ribose-phosphate pyrophosphokinase